MIEILEVQNCIATVFTVPTVVVMSSLCELCF